MNFKIKSHNLGHYYIPSDAKGGVCLEIGANVGSFFSKYSGYFKTIHYYEPVKECYDICKEKSDKLDNVTGWNLAGYKESNKTVKLLNHTGKMAGSIAIEEINNGDWIDDDVVGTPQTISLDDMIASLGVDVVDYTKLDCENAEYYILLNKDLSKLKYIGMEFHWQMGQERYNELLEHILKTHKVVKGAAGWSDQRNKEVFFQLKTIE